MENSVEFFQFIDQCGNRFAPVWPLLLYREIGLFCVADGLLRLVLAIGVLIHFYSSLVQNCCAAGIVLKFREAWGPSFCESIKFCKFCKSILYSLRQWFLSDCREKFFKKSIRTYSQTYCIKNFSLTANYFLSWNR